MLHEPPDLDGCPLRLRALIESCLRKDAGARPAPGQILEFCLAHGAGTTDPGWSPPSPALGPAATAQPPTQRATVAPQSAAPRTARLIPPQSMINAVKLMYLGAALAAAATLTTIATAPAPALKVTIRQQHPLLTPGALGAVITGTLTATIAGALISVGVWLAMARRTRRGRPGVRIWSAIFFGVDCLTVARTYAHGLVTGPTWIVGMAEWGIGLAVIVLL